MPKLAPEVKEKIVALRELGHSYRVITETLKLKEGQAYTVVRQHNGGRLIRHIGSRKMALQRREMPPPNALPWATPARLMARKA